MQPVGKHRRQYAKFPALRCPPDVPAWLPKAWPHSRSASSLLTLQSARNHEGSHM